MDFIVLKMGSVLFDTAHAYGFGIFLSLITQASVQLTDEGLCYRIKSQEITERMSVGECIRKLLTIPSIEALNDREALLEHPDQAVRILDGILAILFTSPGIRIVSVTDMFAKERFSADVIKRSLAKVSAAIERWINDTAWMARHQSHWIDQLLSAYSADQPANPIPVPKRRRMISIPMTIDPAFSYSTRRLTSDGMIADKTNVSIDGTPYAPLLAIIGAAYLLCAQRVAAGSVLFYLPIAESITLSADTTFPLLRSSEEPVEQTLIRQWLDPTWMVSVPDARWAGLAYQIVQTQGAQQSISLGRGYLDDAWLEMIELRMGTAVMKRWYTLLRVSRKHAPLELDNLIDSLLHRRVDIWEAHLRDIAQLAFNEHGASRYLYSLSEVKEITSAMSGSTRSPLRAVLERDQGTLRFGHALRLLGRYNPALLRDLVDDLDGVHQQDALIRVLAQAVQACSVASAKTAFMIIPDDDDLAYLLDDIEQHGAQKITGFLIILSTLHYPRRDGKDPDSNTTDIV